ncbi:MAG: S-layer homology domain-containing protein [Candidatus Peribacteraceae bacterium]|nr:S-layer homology domain-containing protein [Candidatus Peribacteraceae bacterium]
MRRFSFFLLALIPAFALAAYDTSHLPYSDAPATLRTAVAVSMLTQEGILQGYADGTFRPGQTVNRAEFVKVTMKLVPEIELVEGVACFPDVDAFAWYAPFVCAAKRAEIVRGDALDGIQPEQWRFHPARTVNYAEAVKILLTALEIPLVQANASAWYTPYLDTASVQGIGLPGVQPGHLLTRGEVAELAASFLAYSRGELTELRNAQSGQSSISSVSSSSWATCPAGFTCPVATGTNGCATIPAAPCFAGSESDGVCGNAACSGTCYRCVIPSSSSSISSFVSDPNPDRLDTSAFLRLGTTSSVLGAAKIFHNLEPFDVTEISVAFTGSVSSIDQVRLYDSSNGRYLGGASRDASNASRFTLHLANGTFVAPKREERSVYARAILSPFTAGGASGEDVQVDYFKFDGIGQWSNRLSSQSSSDTFSAFETARSVFTEIINAGPATDVLISGTQRTIGSFRFRGTRGDGSADLRVTDLAANVGTAGLVTLTNVQLGADGFTERFPCSMAGNTVTCSGITDSFGSVTSGERTLTLYADVAVSGTSKNAGLQVSLTPAGSPSSAGAVTWTDGSSSFDWVPFDEAALRGTYYSQ